ncbi:heavy metal-binding domain-containing protein [Fusobacterium ulcerans]|uniref:heavy metal-binding domain-containing protein n=1 Tax=Fusobacterium ulcerans TaxID=861 RepID=UPI003FEF0F74
MLITTTENLIGYDIEEYLGYISETVTFGVDGFRNVLLIPNFDVGEESAVYYETLMRAEKLLNSRLEKKAKSLGADAIIGLRITYSEISGGYVRMLLLSGTGTAVIANMKDGLREKAEKRRIKIEEIKEKEEECKRIQEEILINNILAGKTFHELTVEYFNEKSADKKIEMIRALNTKEEVINKREEYKNKDTLMLMLLKDGKDIFAEIELYNRSNKTLYK